MKVLDLFSGIGGFSLGLERAGMETVAFCEIEEYPRQVLKKHWPNVPIFEDVRKLKGEDVGTIDVICGGYPCQPFSTAGKRRGTEDDRHLWPEVYRLLQETRARWFIGENVAGHISMGLDEVLSDLESENYTAQPFVIPACALNAWHRRDRVWIIAHSGLPEPPGRILPKKGQQSRKRRYSWSQFAPLDLYVSNTNNTCREQRGAVGRMGRAQQSLARETGRTWEVEPSVGRMADGVPARVDRLKCLGNAVVPQIPEIIGRAIMAAEGF